MARQGLVFGGVPTGPDVKMIRDRHPDADLEVGQVISYEEIEGIIKETKGSNRWAAVTNRWRKLVEKESGKVIGCEPGIGFKVLTEPEKVGASHSYLRAAGRKVIRSRTVASLVDRSKLTDDERARHDAVQARSAKLIAAAKVKGNGTEQPKLTE